jgi:hypothetical protein
VDLNHFLKTVHMTTHRVANSDIFRLEKPARTIFGTGIHAPKNVRHGGGFLNKLADDVLDKTVIRCVDANSAPG